MAQTTKSSKSKRSTAARPPCTECGGQAQELDPCSACGQGQAPTPPEGVYPGMPSADGDGTSWVKCRKCGSFWDGMDLDYVPDHKSMGSCPCCAVPPAAPEGVYAGMPSKTQGLLWMRCGGCGTFWDELKPLGPDHKTLRRCPRCAPPISA